MAASGVPESPAARLGLSPASPVTEWLLKWSDGDGEALNRLIPLVYYELRRLAGSHIYGHASGQTLSPTDLVHEAYLRLANQPGLKVQSRAHFYAIAARVMRCVLVDRTRRRHAAKRQGNRIRVDADELDGIAQQPGLDLIALDDALTSLAAIDPVKSQIVELRFFGGLAVEDVGEILGLSPRTVARQWVLAKAWLYGQIACGGA